MIRGGFDDNQFNSFVARRRAAKHSSESGDKGSSSTSTFYLQPSSNPLQPPPTALEPPSNTSTAPLQSPPISILVLHQKRPKRRQRMPNNVPKVGHRSTPGIYLHGSVSVLTIVEQIYKPKMAKDWTNFKAEFAARSQQPACHRQAPTILKE